MTMRCSLPVLGLSSLLLMTMAPIALITPLAAQGFGPLADPGSQRGPDASQGVPAGGGFNINPLGSSASGERPKNARTIIESDDGATFENASNSAEFTGHVVVRDPQFDITCDKLHVVLRPDRKGLLKVIASGNVIITQEKQNDRGDVIKSIGKCGKVTYDPTTGDATLEDWPQVQQGINNQIATQQSTVMILNAKGRSRTIGSSRTMIVDQGTKALTP